MYSYYSSIPTSTSYNQAKKRISYGPESGWFCKGCGCELTAATVICPKCSTMTPRVREILNTYPDRSPVKFIGHRYEKEGYTCPLCHRNHIYPKKEYLNTPIIYCTNCFGYFLDPSINEHSITPPNPLFKSLQHIKTSLLICFWNWCVLTPPIKYLIILLCILAPLLIVWDFYSSKKLIEKSKQRFEQNPDYLQTLADMGYLYSIAPEFRSKLKKYGPNGEIRCEYCNQLLITTDSHCKHCNALLPLQRYPIPIESELSKQFTTNFLKKLALTVILALITAIFIWFIIFKQSL